MKRTVFKECKSVLFFIGMAAIFIGMLYIVSSILKDNYTEVANVDEREMPEEIRQLVENGNVEWVAGMWVELKNCELQQNAKKNIDSYLYHKGVVRADVTIQNGKKIPQPYFLMVFADGLPMKFKVGQKEYLTYSIEELVGSKQIEVDFTPMFLQNIGRLDFLLFYDGNKKSSYHMMSYQIWMEQSEEYRMPNIFPRMISRRNGLLDSFSGSVYMAWLWNEDKKLSKYDNIGPSELEIYDGENLIFEAVCARRGKYRTVLFVENQYVNIDVGNGAQMYFDWESEEDNLLQISFKLPDGVKDNVSFFTVCTPIDQDALSVPCAASAKILLKRE